MNCRSSSQREELGETLNQTGVQSIFQNSTSGTSSPHFQPETCAWTQSGYKLLRFQTEFIPVLWTISQCQHSSTWAPESSAFRKADKISYRSELGIQGGPLKKVHEIYKIHVKISFGPGWSHLKLRQMKSNPMPCLLSTLPGSTVTHFLLLALPFKPEWPTNWVASRDQEVYQRA